MEEITEEDKEAALDHDAEGEKKLVAGKVLGALQS